MVVVIVSCILACTHPVLAMCTGSNNTHYKNCDGSRSRILYPGMYTSRTCNVHCSVSLKPERISAYYHTLMHVLYINICVDFEISVYLWLNQYLHSWFQAEVRLCSNLSSSTLLVCIPVNYGRKTDRSANFTYTVNANQRRTNRAVSVAVSLDTRRISRSQLTAVNIRTKDGLVDHC